MGFAKVLATEELPSNEMIGVEVNGEKVLVVNLGGKYYAVGNVCMHRGCMLSDGTLEGENIQCPCHGSTYEVKTGSIIKGPTKKPQPTFQIKVEGNQILVNV